MSTVEVFRVRHGKFQAYDNGEYYGQDDLDGWVNALAVQAGVANALNNKFAWHNLNVVQTIVEAVQVAEKYKYSDYRTFVREVHPVRPAQTVVRPDAVCPGPPATVVGEHQYKTVTSSEGDKYHVGKYFPVTGPETAYYEIVDAYDGWDSTIKAQTLDGHLAAGNWKETDV